MFERFTTSARQTVRQAVADAERLGHTDVGTEHLLLALLTVPDTIAHDLLLRHGVRAEQVAQAVVTGRSTDELDPEALQAVGIDLADVRAKVEEVFGRGALDTPAGGGRRRGRHRPFTRRAKKVLELALREALALRHGYIGDGHILLGLLRGRDGLAARILDDCGVEAQALRRDVVAALPAEEDKAS